jgi:hypothetical protein
MLFSPAMRSAVLQATAICAVSHLYSHYASENIFVEVTHDETFLGMEHRLMLRFTIR